MNIIAKNARKAVVGFASLGLALCLATGAGLAAPRGGGPRGGGPRGGGPAPHFAAHFGGHGAPHFAPHFAGARHFAPHFARHVGAPHFAAHVARGRHGFIHARHAATAVHHVRPHAALPAVAGSRGHFAHLAGRPDPARFAHLRRFGGTPALRPFLAAHWHRHHHLGWVGPLFWPYAYGDVFYEALWPYAYGYYDPFWYYGYGDIYEAMFWPYDYEEYVRGPEASARMNALSQSVTDSCTQEGAEVTEWPIDQIQAALSPNPQQSALLDDLGNATVKASDVIRSHCPTAVAFTPVDRLAQMQERLEGLTQAVAIVQPPLARFYDSLTDEQKARFNDIGSSGANGSTRGRGREQNPLAACAGSVMAFPADRIERIVQPNAAQRAKLDALAAANGKAADLIKASCPSELPATPPDRLAAEGKHLQAMLAGVQTISPALADFYDALSDEQKARFNNLGRQLFAQR